MAITLTAADYPAIRQTIRADIDDVILPDDLIGADAVAGGAVREVLALDPLANTRVGDAMMRLKLAAVYFAAARLAATLVFPTSESFGTYKIAFPEFDAAARAEVLYWQGINEVANALGVTTSSLARAASFTLADGSRGDLAAVYSWSPLAERMRGAGGSSVHGPF